MPPEKQSSFIPVDELMAQVTLEQVLAFYGMDTAGLNLKQVGAEVRSRCFLNCGKTAASGDRALAIQAENPARQWHCHQKECGKSGNLVSLCDFLKPGTAAGGRPRGQRFKEIAADLRAMVAGVLRTEAGETPVPTPAAPAAPAAAPEGNVPLKDSENERARALTELDRKFVVDIASMPPRASTYFRRRPFLAPELCRKWRMGYLPRDTGEDKSGGTMRGKIVYPWLSEAGEVLTWFGRDPEFEDKHLSWQASDRREKEPEKYHFVKGFRRGLELFGQQALRREGVAEQLRGLGLLVVAGPNAVLRLDTLGVPAVALCGSTTTREQAAKAARLARELGGGVVTVLLDCDPEGEASMKQALGFLAQLTPVRLGWTSKMYGGKFAGRRVQSLIPPEWQEIQEFLMTGTAAGWSLA